jgi:hypothetical protein
LSPSPLAYLIGAAALGPARGARRMQKAWLNNRRHPYGVPGSARPNWPTRSGSAQASCYEAPGRFGRSTICRHRQAASGPGSPHPNARPLQGKTIGTVAAPNHREARLLSPLQVYRAVSASSSITRHRILLLLLARKNTRKSKRRAHCGLENSQTDAARLSKSLF